MNQVGTVYLLHFSEPYKHARHYLGFSEDLPARLADHASGKGARLVQMITAAGLTFELVRTWPGTRRDERRIKNQKCSPRLCPICRSKINGNRSRQRFLVTCHEA